MPIFIASPFFARNSNQKINNIYILNAANALLKLCLLTLLIFEGLSFKNDGLILISATKVCAFFFACLLSDIPLLLIDQLRNEPQFQKKLFARQILVLYTYIHLSVNHLLHRLI